MILTIDKIIFVVLSMVSLNVVNLVLIQKEHDYPKCDYVITPKNWMIMNSVISILFVINLLMLFIFEMCVCLKGSIKFTHFLDIMLYLIGASVFGWLIYGIYILVEECSIDSYPKNIIITFSTNVTMQILYFIIFSIRIIRTCRKKTYKVENV